MGSVQEKNLKGIADAIRTQEGSTALIPADDFADRVLALGTTALPERTHTITLVVNDAEGGTVTGGGVVYAGAVITAKVSAVKRYRFIGWQENGQTVNEEENYTFTVNEDRTLVAVFEKLYQLPTGYTEVEYVCNPNKVVTTSPVFNGASPFNSHTLEMEVEFNNMSDRVDVFGAEYYYINEYSPIARHKSSQYLYFYGGKLYVYSGTDMSSSTFPVDSYAVVDVWAKRCHIKVDSSTLTVNGESAALPDSSRSNTGSTACGVLSKSYYRYYRDETGKVSTSTASSYTGDFKLFYIKYYDSDGTLLNHFVPYRKDGTEYVGLYDIITKAVICPSEHTGILQWAAGPDV